MVIAYGISIIVKNLRLKFNTAIDPKEIFIILIYLSSGKLVSAKTFELAKNRMRTKKTALDRYSSFSTMQSNN